MSLPILAPTLAPVPAFTWNYPLDPLNTVLVFPTPLVMYRILQQVPAVPAAPAPTPIYRATRPLPAERLIYIEETLPANLCFPQVIEDPELFNSPFIQAILATNLMIAHPCLLLAAPAGVAGGAPARVRHLLVHKDLPADKFNALILACRE